MISKFLILIGNTFSFSDTHILFSLLRPPSMYFAIQELYAIHLSTFISYTFIWMYVCKLPTNIERSKTLNCVYSYNNGYYYISIYHLSCIMNRRAPPRCFRNGGFN